MLKKNWLYFYCCTFSDKKKKKSSTKTAKSEGSEGSFDFFDGMVGSDGAENGLVYLNAKWDPDDLSDGDMMSPPSPACVRRIKK